LKRAVARREIRPGDRLPSQRDLAQVLRVDPNKVQRHRRRVPVPDAGAWPSLATWTWASARV
ncbi:MAG: hypothetical protein AB1609_20240, partial [Bacillota bacterium]